MTGLLNSRPPIPANALGQQNSQFSRGLLGFIGEDPGQFARGVASAPFTIAPDLLGLLAQFGNKIRDISDPGANQPFPVISGDPIRQAIGLDPSNPQGLLGEFADPTVGVAKLAGLAAKGIGAIGKLAVDSKVWMAAVVPIIGKVKLKAIVKKGDDIEVPETGAIASELTAQDYGMAHRPPMRDSGAPGHDLTGGGEIYPDDIYSSNGARFYGDGSPMDNETMRIAQSLRGSPNADVTIYRAVPHQPNVAEQIADIERDKKAFMKRGRVPSGFQKEGYFDMLSNELDRLEALKDVPTPIRPKISVGDWVTINKKYAIEHGRGLGGFQIIQKKVKAKDIFTNGDSIHEWGYDPQGVGLLGQKPDKIKDVASDLSRGLLGN